MKNDDIVVRMSIDCDLPSGMDETTPIEAVTSVVLTALREAAIPCSRFEAYEIPGRV